MPPCTFLGERASASTIVRPEEAASGVCRGGSGSISYSQAMRLADQAPSSFGWALCSGCPTARLSTRLCRMSRRVWHVIARSCSLPIYPSRSRVPFPGRREAYLALVRKLDDPLSWPFRYTTISPLRTCGFSSGVSPLLGPLLFFLPFVCVLTTPVVDPR